MSACGQCNADTTSSPLVIAGWRWCAWCGTLNSETGSSMHRPWRSLRVGETIPAGPRGEEPGLLSVAQLALANARKLLDKVDRASLLRDEPIFLAIDALHEAVLAITTELQARDAEPPAFDRAHATAAERFDQRDFMLQTLITRTIANGVEAVGHERERCAWIVSHFTKTGADPEGVAAMLERIRHPERSVS